MIEAKRLSFKSILKAIDLRCRAGEVTAILGPNGAGKTTLFRCLSGLYPISGEVRIKGRIITDLSPAEIAKLLALVPQSFEPAFQYSVMDLVLMGRTPYLGLFSTPGEKDLEKARSALESLGIAHLTERVFTELSGGERQLVLLARSLAQGSPILLLDEPTAHLDLRHQVRVLKKIRELAYQRGLTVIMNLHDPNLALLFAHRLVLLKNGRITAEVKPGNGTSKECFEDLYGLSLETVHHCGRQLLFPAEEPDQSHVFTFEEETI